MPPGAVEGGAGGGGKLGITPLLMACWACCIIWGLDCIAFEEEGERERMKEKKRG
jgi:hypothetical protein